MLATLIRPLLHPEPHSDESPVGYLMRVAQANGYKRVQWLFSEDETPFSYSPKKMWDVVNTSEWTGFSNDNSLVSEISHIDHLQLNFSGYRFCIDCLRENPFHRVSWLLNTDVVCSKHRTWLMDECPNCGEKLTFRSIKSLTECQCGADLLDICSAVRAPESVIRMHNFLSGELPEKVDTYAFSEAFNGRNFDREQRVKLISALARWHPTGDHSNFKTGGFNGLTSFPKAAYYATQCADAWFGSQEDFERYLHRLHKEVFHDQERGDKLFRHFYKRVFATCLHPSQKIITNSIQSYIRDNWDHEITRRNTLFNNELVDSHKWIAFQTASNEYGVAKSVLRRGIQEGQLRFYTRKARTRSRLLLHRDDVVEFAQQQSKLLNATSAASLLGVTKQQFYKLIENDLLKGRAPSNSSSGKWDIDVEDIHSLMDGLYSKLAPIDKQYVPLSHAIKKVGNVLKEPFISLVTAVQSGELKASLDPRYVGLRAISVSEDDLENWYRKKLDEESVKVFSIHTLRSYFRVSSLLIPQLVERGLLRRVSFSDRPNTRSITYQEVERFKEQYVLLSKLSRVTEVSSAALITLFREKGIETVDAGWEQDKKLIQKLYYRHELLAVQEVRIVVAGMQDWEFL